MPVIKNRDVDLVSYFDRNVRKIISVVGFRRVGKTFTLLDFAQKYGKEKCVYINFEDERVPKKTEVLSQLVDLLTELKANQPYVLLMDEIQEIPDWSLWARRINETTQHRLILSGSSSKLSSREIPTELRGQTITIPMFPLNWSEFLRFRNADINTLPHAHVLNLLREYLQFGGLPEIVLAEEGLRPLILADYLSSFVDRDIVERYKLRKKEAFTDLLRLLPNTKSYTYTKLANSLKGVGHTVSKSTVIRYMQWLESSFFLSRVEVFSSNVKSRIQTVKKSYLVDNYFSSHFTSTLSPNFGHLMEQAVFHALHRRGVWDPRYGLTYWKDYSGNEVDFVVLHNKKVEELIQVTFASNVTEVSERETKALVKAAKALKKPSGTLITWDVEKTAVIDGVEVKYVSLWKWLANKTAMNKDIEPPDDIPVLDVEPNLGGTGGPSGHFVHFHATNIGEKVAIDCQWGIRGFNYEWRSPETFMLRLGDRKKLEYKISEERPFKQFVPELNIIFEYKDNKGISYFTRRELVLEKVPSGAFYNITKVGTFHPAVILQNSKIRNISEPYRRDNLITKVDVDIEVDGEIKQVQMGIGPILIKVFGFSPDELKAAFSELVQRKVRKMLSEGKLQDNVFSSKEMPKKPLSGFEAYQALRDSLDR